MSDSPPPPATLDRALAAVVATAYAATLVLASGVGGAALAVVTHGLLMAPGLWLVSRVMPGSWVSVVTFGPMLGLGLSTTAMLGLWAAGARGPWVMAAAPLLVAALTPAVRRLRDRWDLPRPLSGDLRAVLLVLCIVPVVVARPFSLVGATLPEGRVYRAYFTADYVWRRALVAEVVKGDFPPANPFYSRDRLHYYWLGHLPDAVAYRALGSVLGLDRILLGSSVAVDAAFVLAIYGIARAALAVPWAAAAGVFWAVFLTSFEGLAGIREMLRAGVPWTDVRYVNIDAATRWFFNGMPIDGLQRVLYYQPHHALAYTLAFIGLLMVATRRRRADPAAFFATGVVLAMCVMISSFVALMGVAAIAVYELTATVRHRSWWASTANAAWAALPMALGAAVVTLLQYVDHQPDNPGTIQVGLNQLAANRVVTMALLSMGPILLVSLAGAWVAWRQRRAALLPAAALIASAVGFYFYVDIRDHGGVYVGWRVGHLMFMAMPAFVGLALAASRALGRGLRLAAWAGVVLLGLGAAPMYLIDAYNTQDVANQTKAPSFNWTLVLSPPELDGLDWIRTHTASDARVQVDPGPRDTNTWAYVPAFAERRMAVGLPLGLVPLAKYKQGSARMRWLYAAPDPVGAFELAALTGVDYIIVGPPERAAHPGVEARFARVGDLMPLVFHNDALSIYEVMRPGHRH